MSFLVQKISELRLKYLEISKIAIIIVISQVAKCSFGKKQVLLYLNYLN